MSTQAQPLTERNTAHRGSAECKPLIDAANKNLFRNNAFRITGLSIDATTREINKHADTLKLMEEFGQGESIHTSAFALKPPPTLDQIRGAIEKLKDPEKRLVDEFFWFWPLDFGQSQSDPTLQAIASGDLNSALETWTSLEERHASSVVATHNLALAYHLAALDWETWAFNGQTDEKRQKKIAVYWREAFRRWNSLAADDRIWDRVVARVREIDDPRLTAGFARRMRSSLPQALGKINAELALAFAESGKIELARIHIQFMRNTLQGLENAEKAAEMVLAPAKARLRVLIDNAKNSVMTDPATGGQVTRDLIEGARPTLFLFELFFDHNEHGQKDVFDEVASACVNGLVSYQRETGNDETFVELLRMSLPLAVSAEVKQRIENNITIGKKNLQGSKLDHLFESINESNETPATKLSRFQGEVIPVILTVTGASGYALDAGYLSTGTEDYSVLFDRAAVVLRNISISAWNEHKDIATAVTAIRLALQHACDKELVQRLQQDRESLQRIQGERFSRENSSGTNPPTYSASTPSAPVENKLVTRGWIAFFVVFVLFIIWFFSTNPNKEPGTTGAFTGTQYQYPSPPSSPPVSRPIYNAPSSSGSTPSYGHAPVFSPPQSPVPTYLPDPYTQVPSSYSSETASARTFRVPHRYNAELNSDAQAIERERVLGNVLKAELERLKREIESERLSLDRTSQYAIDAYNAKVELYNAKLQERRNQLQRFNQMVDNYNNKLRQYGH